MAWLLPTHCMVPLCRPPLLDAVALVTYHNAPWLQLAKSKLLCNFGPRSSQRDPLVSLAERKPATSSPAASRPLSVAGFALGRYPGRGRATDQSSLTNDSSPWHPTPLRRRRASGWSERQGRAAAWVDLHHALVNAEMPSAFSSFSRGR